MGMAPEPLDGRISSWDETCQQILLALPLVISFFLNKLVHIVSVLVRLSPVESRPRGWCSGVICISIDREHELWQLGKAMDILVALPERR